MSALRNKARDMRDKAKDKAKEVISSRRRATPHVVAPSYRQMKQANDAFNAILDDDSQTFGLEHESAKTSVVSASNKPASHSSVEHGASNVAKHPSFDDLFADNFDSADVADVADDLFADDFASTSDPLGLEPPADVLPGRSPPHSSSPIPPPTDEANTHTQHQVTELPVTELPVTELPVSELTNTTQQEDTATYTTYEPVSVSSNELEDSSREESNAGTIQEPNAGTSQESNAGTSQESNAGTSQEFNAGTSQESNAGTREDSTSTGSGTTDLSPPTSADSSVVLHSHETSLDHDELFPNDSVLIEHPASLGTSPSHSLGTSPAPSLGSSLENDNTHLFDNTKGGSTDKTVTSSTSSSLDDRVASNVHPLVHTTSKHLDSGVYESDRGTSEEIVDILDNYYSKEPHKAKVPLKRNSAGNLPPSRPPNLSPDIRRKLKSSNSITQKHRPPADDLFDNDKFVVVPAQSKRSVSLSPRPARKQFQPPTSIPQDVSKPQTSTAITATVPTTTTVAPRGGKVAHEIGEPHLTLPYHLALSLTLYLYYTFNPWSYLSGLLTGFLLVYTLVGTVFVLYVHSAEQEREERKKERRKLRPSEDFLRRTNTDFSALREYKSSKFMATLKYDHVTHHPRQRMKATVKLERDFYLSVKINHDPGHALPFNTTEDLRKCTITNVPEEVAKNRKRRWNKKFPICITRTLTQFTIYLFTPTSREKEDWFRRLRHAADGYTSDDLIQQMEKFFGYMEDYFPQTSQKLRPQRPPHRPPPPGSAAARKQLASHGNRIQFSRDTEDSLPEEEMISITRESGPRVSRHSRINTTTSSADRLGSTSSLDDGVFVARPLGDTLWLNAVAARLCWDIWHDKRWKDWVHSRIQKMLTRVKTPPFMEQLTLTDVHLGNDMPVVNRLCGGPNLDLRGMWVYLDVTYEGCFVMTITTKLKRSSGREEGEEQGQQMRVMKNKGASLPVASPHTKNPSPRSGVSHSSAARALGGSVDPYNDNEEIDSGSSDEELQSALGDSIASELHGMETPHEDHSSAGGRLKSAVKNFGLKVGSKVAKSGFVRRAFDKVSSYPLVLTVVVNRLDGELAINIPPPTTDTIWFGFTKSPRLELSAKPKLGQREVKLAAVSQWIEKKLREVVKKKLVLPEMEDVVVKVLNSGLAEDTQKILVTNDDDKK